MKSPIRYSKVAVPQTPAQNTPVKTVKPADTKVSSIKTPVVHHNANKKK